MSSYPGYSGGGGSDYDKEVDLSLAKVNLWREGGGSGPHFSLLIC